MTNAGYICEIEIKMSRSDFKADFKKQGKHDFLSGKSNLYDGRFGIVDNAKRPNRFYFCFPEGLINPSEIPDYAGYIEITPGGHIARGGRIAPLLHKKKEDMTKKFLSRFEHLSYRQRYEIKTLKAQIAHYQKKYD